MEDESEGVKLEVGFDSNLQVAMRNAYLLEHLPDPSTTNSTKPGGLRPPGLEPDSVQHHARGLVALGAAQPPRPQFRRGRVMCR